MKRKWGDGDVLVRALLPRAGLRLGRVQQQTNCQGVKWGSPSTVGSQHCAHHHTGTRAWKKKKDIFLHFGGYLNGNSIARAPGEKGKSLAGSVPV